MEKYTSYCTHAQTAKAYCLGAPLIIKYGAFCTPGYTEVDFGETDEYSIYAIIPTTQQMIGWLRDKGFHFDEETTENYSIITIFIDGDIDFYKEFKYYNANERRNVELDVIDAALKYLGKKGK